MASSSSSSSSSNSNAKDKDKKAPVIDLTDETEKIELPSSPSSSDFAILRTLVDNGHCGPLPVIKRPSRTEDEVNVVKVVKRQTTAIPTRSLPKKIKPPTTQITSHSQFQSPPNFKAIQIPSDPPPINFADKKCPICFDALKNPSVTLCGHVFCTECIKEAVKAAKQCPMCRKKMTAKGFHPLYM